MDNTQDIITLFESLVDDTTELSSDESLALAERVYRRILNTRPWEFLKKEFTGTVSGTSIALPSDFAYMTDNYNYTDNTIETVQRSRPCVVFVGDNYEPYRVVNFSDRKQYRNQSNVCWVDVRQDTLEFASSAASGKSISYDYIYNPDSLTLATAPVFPSRFYPSIAYAMAVEDMSIQIFDKAKSYAKENNAMYNTYLADMAYWNANIQQN